MKLTLVAFLKVALLQVALLSSVVAQAGLISPCRDPIVLPGPKVQVFILPVQSESHLTENGRQLATILQRHVLFAALKYRSIAIEELTGDPRECGLAETIDMVRHRLGADQAAIFLSTRLFEQADALQLQSNVTLWLPGTLATTTWRLGASARVSNASLPAASPASSANEAVAFQPRRIPLSFVSTLADAQREARRLHTQPDSNSAFSTLPDDPHARIGFEVLETTGDWLHVRLFPEQRDGWISAHALVGGDELKGTFPELFFVDGLIGYLQLLVPAAPGAPALRATTADTAIGALNKYLELTSDRGESEARALATVLQGLATLRVGTSAQWSLPILADAQRYFSRARELAPGSTLANNFYLACAAAICARGGCPASADGLHAQYLAALAQDPTSVELLNNLDALYAAAQRGVIKLSIAPRAIAAQRALAREAGAANAP